MSAWMAQAVVDSCSMVAWGSVELLARQQDDFVKLQHVVAGIYFWEFAISLDFDWSFISGRRRLRWPMFFYFLDRYCLLFAMIGLLITLDIASELNCMALARFNQVVGNAAVGLASINLAIRTIAIWAQNRYVVGLLTVLILGHWSVILQGILITSEWVPGVGCSLVSVNSTILSAMFIYSVVFDFIVLSLSAYKLYNRRKGSQMVQLLFKDGLIYFVVAFVSNVIATVFMLLNLNPVMTSIANVPAAAASTIVACRVVRRLFKYQSRLPDIYVSGGLGAFSRRNDVDSDVRPGMLAFARSRDQEDETHHDVHIPMSRIASSFDGHKFHEESVNAQDIVTMTSDNSKFKVDQQQ